jgi:tripartite-type tricarboxylate transporter receptor subunit TctC
MLTTAARAAHVAAACLLASTAATAAVPAARKTDSTYPARPIRMIVAQTPGGNADIIARAVALKMGEAFGQQVVVDNRAGASGIIATEIAARATPDGHTLLVTPSSFGVNPSLHRKLPYDPLKDLAPITLIAAAPNVLVVHPSLPVKTVKDLIDVAKAKPGQLNFGSSGNAGSPHLAGELFKLRTGVDIVHVPYKGAPAALTGLIAGQIHLNFASMPSAIGHVRAGKLRAVAVTSAKRSVAMPELPTVMEAGVRDFETSAWQGLFAPAGVPASVVMRVNQEVARALHAEELKKRLMFEGAEPVANTPAEFRAFIAREIPKWAEVVKAAGIRVD